MGQSKLERKNWGQSIFFSIYILLLLSFQIQYVYNENSYSTNAIHVLQATLVPRPSSIYHKEMNARLGPRRAKSTLVCLDDIALGKPFILETWSPPNLPARESCCDGCSIGPVGNRLFQVDQFGGESLICSITIYKSGIRLEISGIWS